MAHALPTAPSTSATPGDSRRAFDGKNGERVRIPPVGDASAVPNSAIGAEWPPRQGKPAKSRLEEQRGRASGLDVNGTPKNEGRGARQGGSSKVTGRVNPSAGQRPARRRGRSLTRGSGNRTMMRKPSRFPCRRWDASSQRAPRRALALRPGPLLGRGVRSPGPLSKRAEPWRCTRPSQLLRTSQDGRPTPRSPPPPPARSARTAPRARS